MGAQADAALRGEDLLGRRPPAADLARAGEVDLGPVPEDLALTAVARSHGWVGLAPYAHDRPAGELHRVLDGPVAVLVREVSAGGGRLVADWPEPGVDPDPVRRALRWCLGLDDDVSRAPAATRGTRLLRSPTVLEDAVKVVLSAGTSYASTRRWCERLVDLLGEGGAWPTPSVLLGALAVLRAEVRVGYRAETVVALAHRAEELEALRDVARDPDVATELLHAALLDLPGIGPHGAGLLLGLLGRPRGLSLDGWALSRSGLTAGQVRGRYAAYGAWAGVVQHVELATGTPSS